mmetsp:Transcript_45979/g.94074  ORF Transcript_45979/g.94074 Transcript_45979/m.94074 type:complete len:82 (-) Transcript_45979:31-276(-)
MTVGETNKKRRSKTARPRAVGRTANKKSDRVLAVEKLGCLSRDQCATTENSLRNWQLRKTKTQRVFSGNPEAGERSSELGW